MLCGFTVTTVWFMNVNLVRIHVLLIKQNDILLIFYYNGSVVFVILTHNVNRYGVS